MSVTKRMLERSWTRLSGIEVGQLSGPCGVCRQDTPDITFVVEDGLGQTYPACYQCALNHGMVCEACGDRGHDGLIVWLFTEGRAGIVCRQCEQDLTA